MPCDIHERLEKAFRRREREIPDATAKAMELCDHDVSLPAWGEYLSGVCPEMFDDPPLPRESSQALSHDARVELYAQRQEQGFHLYHPDDLCTNRAVLEKLQFTANFVDEGAEAEEQEDVNPFD